MIAAIYARKSIEQKGQDRALSWIERAPLERRPSIPRGGQSRLIDADCTATGH
jgi:hypothetical protein